MAVHRLLSALLLTLALCGAAQARLLLQNTTAGPSADFPSGFIRVQGTRFVDSQVSRPPSAGAGRGAQQLATKANSPLPVWLGLCLPWATDEAAERAAACRSAQQRLPCSKSLAAAAAAASQPPAAVQPPLAHSAAHPLTERVSSDCACALQCRDFAFVGVNT